MRTQASKIATEALAAVRPHVEKGLEDLAEFRFAWADLEADTAATLERSVLSTDAKERRELAEDLERYLPARRAALVSIVATRAGSTAHAAFSAALDVAIKVVVGVAKVLV